MKYEIVELKEKKIVGFAARTSNEDPQMGAVIGDLWKQLYTPENTEKIQNRVNTYAIGLYSDYDKGGYQVTAGFEMNIYRHGSLPTDWRFLFEQSIGTLRSYRKREYPFIQQEAGMEEYPCFLILC